MTADMSALIARLEAAEVGSREMGHDVLLALGWHRNQIGNFYGPLYQWSSPDHSPHLISGKEDNLPNPVLSLDAALALAERVLGEWLWQFDIQPGRSWAQGAPEAWPEGLVASDRGGVYCSAATLPLALVIAILRAKQGEGE